MVKSIDNACKVIKARSLIVSLVFFFLILILSLGFQKSIALGSVNKTNSSFNDMNNSDISTIYINYLDERKISQNFYFNSYNIRCDVINYSYIIRNDFNADIHAYVFIIDLDNNKSLYNTSYLLKSGKTYVIPLNLGEINVNYSRHRCDVLNKLYLSIQEFDDYNRLLRTHGVVLRQVSLYEYFKPKLVNTSLVITDKNFRDDEVVITIPILLNREASYIVYDGNIIDDSTVEEERAQIGVKFIDNVYLFNKTYSSFASSSERLVMRSVKVILFYNGTDARSYLKQKLSKGINISFKVIDNYNHVYNQTISVTYKKNVMLSLIKIGGITALILIIIYIVLELYVKRLKKRKKIRDVDLISASKSAISKKKKKSKIWRWIRKHDKIVKKEKRKEIEEGKKIKEKLLKEEQRELEKSKEKPKKNDIIGNYIIPLVIVILIVLGMVIVMYRNREASKLANINITNITSTKNVKVVSVNTRYLSTVWYGIRGVMNKLFAGVSMLAKHIYSAMIWFIVMLKTYLYKAIVAYWAYIVAVAILALIILIFSYIYHKNIRLFISLMWAIYTIIIFVIMFCSVYHIRSNYIRDMKFYDSLELPKQNKFNFVLYKGEVKVINLSHYFYDPDNDKLYFSVAHHKNIIVEINESTDMMSIKAKKGFSGPAWLIVGATDMKSPPVQAYISITVFNFEKKPEGLLAQTWFLIRHNLILIIVTIFAILIITYGHSRYNKWLHKEKKKREDRFIKNVLYK